MGSGTEKKVAQLGQPQGTAQNKLRKLIMFSLLVQLGKDVCFHCAKKIESVDHLSVEHKIPWLDSKNPKELFFDLSNIAFSHLSCNISKARRPARLHFTSEAKIVAMRDHRRKWREQNPEYRHESYLRTGK